MTPTQPTQTNSIWANIGHIILIAFQAWVAIGHPGVAGAIPSAAPVVAALGNAALASPVTKWK